jgi:uncharacterized protein (DUF305 family)
MEYSRMIRRSRAAVPRAVVVMGVAFFAACGAAVQESGPRVIEPGAPGEAGRVAGAGEPTRTGEPRHTQADVEFMQHMIAHHRQAVEMTGLVADRASRDDIRLLAGRIQASQADEIRQMERWLRQRGEALPHEHAHHGHGAGHDGMPGMLTDAQLAQLAAARGAEFDRLFLDFMIFHHRGALTMVAQLFASPGAGQETEIFQFASHVDSDQRIEIERMQRMLSSLQRGSE